MCFTHPLYLHSLQVPLPFSTFIGFCKELHRDIDSNLGACCKSEKDVPSDESSQRCIASEDDNKQVYLAQVEYSSPIYL